MHAARLAFLVLALVSLGLACWLTGCSGKTEGPDTKEAITASSEASSSEARAVTPVSATVPASTNTGTSGKPSKPADPQVVVRTTAGDFTLQLFAEKSPQTVDNFLRMYADRGFYEQTIVHHADPQSMIIAGGYTADLDPKPTRTPIYNESRGGLSNDRGTVAMICDPQSPHSATSQFFVNLVDNPQLDARSTEEEDVFGFCVFGKVVDGMDVVERIASAPTASQGDFPRIPSPTVTITAVERLR